MKVDFTLNALHKLILQILRETKEIPVSRLAKIYGLFTEDKVSIGRIAEAFREQDEPPFLHTTVFSLGTRATAMERDITGLEFVGLVELIRSPSTVLLGVGRDKGLEGYNARLTEEGQRVAERLSQGRRLFLRPRVDKQTSVFVACAFGKDDIDALYERYLEPACSSINYQPDRVDMNEPPQTITEDIMRGITQAACILADLTYARPSVYFEVGLAHGLGIPLILCCRKDHYKSHREDTRVHFDLEQFKISFWSQDKEGRFHWAKNMEPGHRLAKLLPKLGSQQSDALDGE